MGVMMMGDTPTAPFAHKPVLLKECIEQLQIKPDGVYFDGTEGLGGHSFEIAKRLTNGRLIGSDKDGEALARAGVTLAGFGGQVTLIRAEFADIDDILAHAGVPALDGALLDLGVSSYQLDDPTRGFSYMHDGPLDMRMDTRDGPMAYDIINDYDERALARIFYEYGEERWSARVAQFILSARREKPIQTTAELVTIIKQAIPKAARLEGAHPAKRIFQALRIETNNELAGLGQALRAIMGRLKPGGRLCVCAFHSLEDRIVKQTFRAMEDPCGECAEPMGDPCKCDKVALAKVVTRKPITPGDDELADNHRARSTKLRVAERL